MYLLKELARLLMSVNDDNRIKSIDSIETYAYWTNEEIIHRNEEIKCSDVKKQCKEK